MSTQFAISDYFCSSQGCPICKWNKNPIVILKGLCQQSNIEYRYVLRINKLYQGHLAFKGYSNDYYIVFDKRKQGYVLAKSINFKDQSMPINDDKIIGVFFGKSTAMPLGLQNWGIYDGVCNQTIQLKLTSVRLYPKICTLFHNIHTYLSVQCFSIYLCFRKLYWN